MAIELLKTSELTTGAPGKYSDGGGLYLDVRSVTSASWLYRFTWGGKADEVGLGSRKKVTAERARELRAWCADELAAGRNPKESLQAMKLERVREAARPKAQTIQELARDHVQVIARNAKTLRGRREWVASLSARRIGRIANMDPAMVTNEDVQELLTRLYTGKDLSGRVICKPKACFANYVRQRLTKLLGWARATGRITTPGWENPVRLEDNVEHTVDRGDHVTKHHEALPAEKVGAFLAKLRDFAVSGRGGVLALEWQVVSACRPGEAAGADWSELDWANDCWVIAAGRMKKRRLHRIPLTKRHHEILDELLAGGEPPAAGPLFSVNGGMNPVSTQTLRFVLFGIEGQLGPTLHGFRSSFATWARAETYPVTLPTGELRWVRLYDEAMIEECLAHVVGDASRRAYVRDDFLELRRPLMEAWASYCGKVLEASEVVPMRRRKAA